MKKIKVKVADLSRIMSWWDLEYKNLWKYGIINKDTKLPYDKVLLSLSIEGSTEDIKMLVYGDSFSRYYVSFELNDGTKFKFIINEFNFKNIEEILMLNNKKWYSTREHGPTITELVKDYGFKQYVEAVHMLMAYILLHNEQLVLVGKEKGKDSNNKFVIIYKIHELKCSEKLTVVNGYEKHDIERLITGRLRHYADGRVTYYKEYLDNNKEYEVN